MASAVPVAPEVLTVTDAQVPSVGIAGKAIAPAQSSFAGAGGGSITQMLNVALFDAPEVQTRRK